eukprot:COSAG02_NODE_1587_length_11808_cov_8.640875_3_plen_112_part_00
MPTVMSYYKGGGGLAGGGGGGGGAPLAQRRCGALRRGRWGFSGSLGAKARGLVRRGGAQPPGARRAWGCTPQSSAQSRVLRQVRPVVAPEPLVSVVDRCHAYTPLTGAGRW